MIKKIIALLILVSSFYFVGAMGVLAANDISVSVKTYLGNSTPVVSNQGGKSRGQQLTFDHGNGQYHGFAFYAINDTIRPDLPAHHEFKVMSKMSISVIYDVREAGEVTQHAVVFVSSNRKVVKVQYVAEGGTASADGITLTPPPNMEWKTPNWLTTDNKGLDVPVNENRVYYAQFQLEAIQDSFQLTVVGGTGSGSYTYNSVATITPNAAPEGKVFSHWADAEGNKLSYKSSYKVSILAATSIQAVFVDGATSPAEQPVVSMSDDLGIKGSQFVTYKGQMQLPAGYSIVEYGFIFSKSSDVLTLSSAGATIVPSNIHYGVTGEFMRSFPVDTFNSIRAYMIVSNGSVESFIYSDNKVMVSVIETFNNYTGTGSYADGSFTGVNQISWLVGQSRGDLQLTGKALTFKDDRNNAKLEANIPNGIHSISVDYKNAFTKSASVLIYVNDVLVGTSPLSDKNEVATYQISDINITGNFKLTIKTSNGQLSIDNLSWTSFGEITGYKPTISASNITMTEEQSLNPLTGVTASDVEDGVLTSSISYVVKDSLDNVIDPVDFTLLTHGDYTITYSVQDSDNNITNLTVDLVVLELLKYDVIFNTNGGSSIDTIFNVPTNTTITQPDDPTKSGNVFARWYSNEALTQVFSFSTPITSNITLYAKWLNVASALTVSEVWDLAEHNDTFDLVGVVVAKNDVGYILQDTLTGEMISIIDATNTPNLEDELFLTGTFSVDYEIATFKSISEYKVLSVDNAINYTKENAVDIDFASFDTQAYQGKLVRIESPWLMLNNTSNTGYLRIAGAESGLNTEIYDGNYIGILNSVFNQNMSYLVTRDFTPIATQYVSKAIYVIFYHSSGTYHKAMIIGDQHIETLQTFEVTFNSDTDSAVPTQTVVNGRTATQPANPTKLGGSFAGWYTDPETQNAFSFTTAITSSITLYAKWITVATYTVTFNSNGGSEVLSQTVNSGSIINVPNPAPTKGDEQFLGWFTDDGIFANAYDFSTPVYSNFTLYADWDANVSVQDKTMVFTFTNKSWVSSRTIDGGTPTTVNWTSHKDGLGFASGQGIQVSTGTSGANGTSPSISNIKSIEIMYATNKSDGAGTIVTKIGSTTVQTFTVSKTGGTTPRTGGVIPVSNLTGQINITVTTTTNSVYIHSIIIVYSE